MGKLVGVVTTSFLHEYMNVLYYLTKCSQYINVRKWVGHISVHIHYTVNPDNMFTLHIP